MTRLTVYQRSAFVRAVLDDVPVIDYDEQVRSIMQKWALSKMTPKARALYKEDPSWINTTSIDMPGSLLQACVYTNLGYGELRSAAKADAELWTSIEDLASKKSSDSDSRDKLRNQVRAAIVSCSTVKAAHERMPEFVKYLPLGSAPVDRTVPVIANLVSDLTKAGWPAERKAA
jgi:hypothetical protein